VPSFTLGVDEVSPLRMAEAYATLAAGGKHCASYAITAIDGPDGTALPAPGQSCENVLSAQSAAQVTDLLRGVIDGPDPGRTGRLMTLGATPAAGKTGTTNSATAVWFVGYTDHLAAAVWAGYPDSSRPLRDITIGNQFQAVVTGAALPGRIWTDAMVGALGLPTDAAQREAAAAARVAAQQPIARPADRGWDSDWGDRRTDDYPTDSKHWRYESDDDLNYNDQNWYW
jgi:membrane peptidoglycan carboxypeptidase